jgi:hypothetical protein
VGRSDSAEKKEGGGRICKLKECHRSPSDEKGIVEDSGSGRERMRWEGKTREEGKERCDTWQRLWRSLEDEWNSRGQSRPVYPEHRAISQTEKVIFILG